MKTSRSGGSVSFWGQIIIGFIGIGSLALGIYFCWGAFSIHSAIVRARQTEPLLSVDLSKTGSYTADFEQIHDLTLGQGVVLRLNPPFETLEQLHSAIEGLSVKICIKDKLGEKHFEQTFSSADVSIRIRKNLDGINFPCFYLDSLFALGDYELYLTILKPADGLSGRSQELVMTYFVCGIVRLWVWVLGAISVPCFIVAGVMGLLIYRFRKSCKPSIRAT